MEDVLARLLVAKAKLERVGYSGDIVGDGLEAIRVVRSGNYGVILMDIQMPKLDGGSETKEIRALPGTVKASTPIIAFTANAMKGDEEGYLDAGMNGYLSKPLDNQELEAELAGWFVDA